MVKWDLTTRQVSEFKETEIGKIPEDWRITQLENVCERVSVGYVGLTSKFFCGPEGVLFLRSQNVRPRRVDLTDIRYVTQDFHENNKKSQLREGDIMIVRVGSNRGDCCVVPKGFDKLNCANIVFARPKLELSGFLGHFFQSTMWKQQLDSISTGSAQGVLNTKHIAKLQIPVPPSDQSLKITFFLNTFEFKIQNLQNQNKILEQIAQTIFKSWFVDFDGVTEFDDSEFDDSEFGKIPKGWKVKKITEIAEFNPENIGKDFQFSEINYMDTSSVTEGKLTEIQIIDKKNMPSRAKRLVKQNDVLISTVRPNLKHYYFVQNPQKNLVVSTGFVVIRSTNISPFYLYYFLTTSLFIEYLTGVAVSHTSAYPSFLPEIIENTKICVPSESSDEIFHNFNNLLTPIHKKLERNATQISLLTKTRDILLPKLMSGEIRV